MSVELTLLICQRNGCVEAGTPPYLRAIPASFLTALSGPMGCIAFDR